MKDLQIEDLQILFISTRVAYPGYTFESWKKEVEFTYSEYCISRNNAMTFSQWINGQILLLNY